jgi:phosphoglycolate phosphatase-like HAD superfamily hydrolase
MKVISPKILALDFDGVICDGLMEYFEVSWLAYSQIWSPSDTTPPDGLAKKFNPLRAVIETGWEMPVLIKALVDKIPEGKIYKNWVNIAQEILQKDNLNAKEVGTKLDTLRDEWIAKDLHNWLGLHRFYPGVIKKLKATLGSNVILYIITTKEGRFVQELLQKEAVNLSPEFIFGKEKKRPKYEILRELIKVHNISPEQVWFVEDRLKTLELVQQQSDLGEVKLYLADWGYNTQQEREAAQNNSKIQVVSLLQFDKDFSEWGNS